MFSISILSRAIAVIAVCAVANACSVAEKVQVRVGNDLVRTGELADKYGKPEVKQCSDFLLASLNSEDSAKAKLDALLKEETDGLLSAALKAALVADIVRELQSSASQAKFEADFKTNCSAVAGDLMIRALRDARTIGSRGQK